ncbi:hypothetical protein AHF37_04015 [Paragonimus kellicotti]|nr:hypothetical protein AHF37_04015 [Paragonimus kellicotti]
MNGADELILKLKANLPWSRTSHVTDTLKRDIEQETSNWARTRSCSPLAAIGLKLNNRIDFPTPPETNCYDREPIAFFQSNDQRKEKRPASSATTFMQPINYSHQELATASQLPVSASRQIHTTHSPKF